MSLNKYLYLSIITLYSINFIMFLSFNNMFFTSYKPIIIYLIKNLLCLLVFYVTTKVSLSYIKNNSFYIFIFCLFLLFFVHFLGIIGLGAKRWINLGFFYLQPSEFMKICLPIYLSSYLCEKLQNKNHLSFLEVIKYLLIILLPIGLIILEPDLGTGVILITITGSLLFVSGLQRIYIYSFIIGGLVLCPIIWNKMYDYQKNRILIYIYGGNEKKEGYQIKQSKITIGSGGITGKGFLKGSQFRYNFLPKPDTDFIFSCICEEWGLLGGLFVTFIFFYLSLMAMITSLWLQNSYEKLLSFSISIYIFFSFFFNIGMTMGLLPLVGVPIPVLSRGGSSAMTFLINIGLLINMRNSIKK
jgi:rod shape determining protein RodA